MDFKRVFANQKGVALLFVLFITAFFALTGMSFLNMVINKTKLEEQSLAKSQTFYLAKAGVAKGTWFLQNSVRPLQTTKIILGSLETGNYKANLIPKTPSQGKQIIEGEAEGWKNEASSKIRVTWELVYESVPAQVRIISWR